MAGTLVTRTGEKDMVAFEVGGRASVVFNYEKPTFFIFQR
jgi:hypothetical protein